MNQNQNQNQNQNNIGADGVDRSSAYHSWDDGDFKPEWKRERYLIAPTGDEGVNTMRKRFCVVCKECDRILHHNTTWPGAYIEPHEAEHKNYDKENSPNRRAV